MNQFRILNTHSNADHIGENRYLQGQTGCKIYSGGIERAFTEYPVLEPAFFYGGYPCRDLRHKFLLAQASENSDFSDPDFPKEIEVIPLQGHFFHMVGCRMPDQTVFPADCIISKATLEKYAVSFIYDVGAYLKTMDMVENMEESVFVPAHAEAAADIKELVQYNRNKVYEMAGRILYICQKPANFEKILQQIFKEYGLAMNFEQYVLVGSTVRSCLSWLKDTGRLAVIFEDHLLLRQAVQERPDTGNKCCYNRLLDYYDVGVKRYQTDCSPLRAPTILPQIRISWSMHSTFILIFGRVIKS